MMNEVSPSRNPKERRKGGNSIDVQHTATVTSAPNTEKFTMRHQRPTCDFHPIRESKIKECSPTTAPSMIALREMRHPFLITQYGPMVTSGPRTAPSSTMAVGSMRTFPMMPCVGEMAVRSEVLAYLKYQHDRLAHE
jgi:hypothetical protein